MATCDLGVIGLATMGANLARNAARNGYAVALYNRHAERTDELVRTYGTEGTLVATHDLDAFVRELKPPRAVLLMVKAGKPVDEVIDEIVPHLERDDILIDGGNSLFSDTQRRQKRLAERGLRYIGTGVSGGEEGALEGPSIMPGGDADAYERVRPMFERMSAQVDGTPCCTFIGSDGAGHYVKMVHNGIEYADMQLIAEAYALISRAYGYDAPRIAEIFEQWNEGELDSYLIEITASVLRKVDAATDKPLVDVIRDAAEQKGTGRWTAQQALELGVPITTITEAVFARSLSALKDEREAAAKRYPLNGAHAAPPSDETLDAIRDALFASKIVAYAQGFAQLAAAAEHFKWKLELAKIATIWRGGCIIRAKFLDRIKDAYEHASPETNLLTVPYFRDAVAARDDAWRTTVKLAIDRRVATPAFSSALAYFDGYRAARGPANLLQGLRDYFGSHGYERVDKPGSFHVRWSQDGVEVAASG